jgi:hypothetical protein
MYRHTLAGIPTHQPTFKQFRLRPTRLPCALCGCYSRPNEACAGHTVQMHMQVLATLGAHSASDAPEVREVRDGGASDVHDVDINDVGVDTVEAQQHGAAAAGSGGSGEILVLVSQPDGRDDSTSLSLSHSLSAGSSDPYGLDEALCFWVEPPSP